MSDILYTKIRATAIYNSGREEYHEANLNKDQVAPKSFYKKANDLKNFPTVKEVKIEKLP